MIASGKEAVGGSGFTSLGDNADYDFEIDDLTLDGNWYELSLAGVTPANATWVKARVKVEGTVIDESFQLRNADHVNTKSALNVRTQVAGGIGIYGADWIEIGADQKLEYKGTANFTTVDIAFQAWM